MSPMGIREWLERESSSLQNKHFSGWMDEEAYHGGCVDVVDAALALRGLADLKTRLLELFAGICNAPRRDPASREESAFDSARRDAAKLLAGRLEDDRLDEPIDWVSMR